MRKQSKFEGALRLEKIKHKFRVRVAKARSDFIEKTEALRGGPIRVPPDR